MNPATLRALEFDRIVSVVAGLAVTSTGQDRLGELEPMTDATAVARAQRATTEGTRFLADHPGFPLRPPSDLDEIISALAVDGRALEPLRLFGVADYLESIEGIGDRGSDVRWRHENRVLVPSSRRWGTNDVLALPRP